MRVPGLIGAALLVIAACGSSNTPSASAPTQTPTAAPLLATPEQPAPELMLGQTFGLYYDPEVERVVLVNGAQVDGPAKPTELWTWDGTSWELLNAEGPEARNFGAVAFDPERQV